MEEKTKQTVQDEDRDDMIGVNWMGYIPSDALVTVFLNGKVNANGTTNSVRKGGHVSYKVYDPSYPFENDLPDPCV